MRFNAELNILSLVQNRKERACAQTIDAPNDEYVWGGDFVNVISAIKILQSVIAHAVAGHNRTPSRFLTGSRSSSHNPTCLYPLLVFL